MTHLDESIDIHVGGQDLVFPHHENEVAQSEAATGKQFAKYWLHVRLLETEEEKMSSSLGNYFTVADAVEEFGSDVLRTFLLSTAYTSRATYSDETISEAEERWDRLSRGYERAAEACDGVDAYAKVTDETLRDAVADARSAFEAAMNDDFNTREAMTALLDLTAAVNSHLDAHEQRDYQGSAALSKRSRNSAAASSGWRSATTTAATCRLPATWSIWFWTSASRNERPVTTNAPTNSGTNWKRSASRCRTPTTGRPTGSERRQQTGSGTVIGGVLYLIRQLERPSTLYTEHSVGTTMRKGILTLLVGLLVASSGCVGLITGETVEFDSAPASVGDSALEETGYEQSMADEQTIERTVTVAGQERTIRVTNHVRQYDRGIDLGPLGEVNAGRFIVFSTPSASVAGKSLNPAASWSNERLVEEVASRNDQINDVQFERNRSVEALGESREVAVFSGTTSIEVRKSTS